MQNPIHPIYGSVGNNGLYSNNPETTVIDISSVAAGQANVLVKFYYSDENQWAVHWAVDDVVIYADFQNDLKLEKILLIDNIFFFGIISLVVTKNNVSGKVSLNFSTIGEKLKF